MTDFINLNNIIGVEFVLSKWGAVHAVGQLHYLDDTKQYTFQYYGEYLKLKDMPPLTAEFPRRKEIFTSNVLFSSINWFLSDEYKSNIRTRKMPIDRLCFLDIESLNIKTYPIYDLKFTSDMFLEWCNNLKLSLKTVCPFFNISRTLIKRMRKADADGTGNETLPRLALYYYVESAFEFLLLTNGHFLTDEERAIAKKWKDNHFKRPYIVSRLKERKGVKK